MTIDSLHIGMAVTILGKAFLMAARAQPPLPPGAGYYRRWLHDFIQEAASNQDKVEHPTDAEKEKEKEKEAETPTETPTETPAPKAMSNAV